MSERKELVTVYRVNLYCDECDTKMKELFAYQTNFILWTYECPNCSQRFETEERYPKIIYVPVSSLED